MANAHFRDFRTYARHALALLKLSAAINDEHIDACWTKYGDQQGKVAAMWALKGTIKHLRQTSARCSLGVTALMTPCTESLVLIDRLLYFKERGISAALIPLFDKSQSPRSFVLVAKR